MPSKEDWLSDFDEAVSEGKALNAKLQQEKIKQAQKESDLQPELHRGPGSPRSLPSRSVERTVECNFCRMQYKVSLTSKTQWLSCGECGRTFEAPNLVSYDYDRKRKTNQTILASITACCIVVLIGSLLYNNYKYYKTPEGEAALYAMQIAEARLGLTGLSRSDYLLTSSRASRSEDDDGSPQYTFKLRVRFTSVTPHEKFSMLFIMRQEDGRWTMTNWDNCEIVRE